ncbi:hypothetical protein PU560_13760 [Georgenia sp. 10Sc9-8]|uniref:Uncharacterized protein n=1 Tax=Georgenia halotolerans TaxID=3028317 RepID=A0ABT5U276_9MICO|nr:hypothetical protein [Georgenia halotolerans]
MEPVLILLLILALAYVALRSSRGRLEAMSRSRWQATDADHDDPAP